MLLRHRGVLTLLVLVALSGAAVGGAWLAWSWPVDPATASLPQLGRVLVWSDLRTLPVADQRAWVDRLQSELHQHRELPTASVQLTAGQQQQLQANLAQLQEVWFKTRAQQYAELEPAQRRTFLQSQIELVEAWSKLEAGLAPSKRGGGLKELLEQIDRWQATAEMPQRAAMKQALADGTVCWLTMTDLAQQSSPARQALAERLAREVRKGNLPHAVQNLTNDERQQLVGNAQLLVEAYVHALARHYVGLAKNERKHFIDEELAAFEQSGVLALLAKNGDTTPAARPSTLQLAEQTMNWIDHAPPDERADVAALVTAIQQRLILRQLPAWLRQ